MKKAGIITSIVGFAFSMVFSIGRIIYFVIARGQYGTGTSRHDFFTTLIIGASVALVIALITLIVFIVFIIQKSPSRQKGMGIAIAILGFIAVSGIVGIGGILIAVGANKEIKLEKEVNEEPSNILV